jgi:hypothetical protein
MPFRRREEEAARRAKSVEDQVKDTFAVLMAKQTPERRTEAFRT